MCKERITRDDYVTCGRMLVWMKYTYELDNYTLPL